MTHMRGFVVDIFYSESAKSIVIYSSLLQPTKLWEAMKNYRAQYIEGLATVLWVLYRLYRSLYTFDFFLMFHTLFSYFS